MFSRWLWGWTVVAVVAITAAAPAGTLAQFRTVFGDIAVELYDQDKPATVQNFIHHVQSGRYTNVFSHRLVPGFVLQAGGFTITNRGETNWGAKAVPTDPPVTNEFNRGRFFSNGFGTIAMAKTSDPDSATSQFFFNLADNSAALDNPTNSGGFTVFGRVIAGTNVLGKFNEFKYWTSPWATVPQATNLVLYQYYYQPYETLPLLYPSVTDSNLLFLEITLLNAQIAARPGPACEISWNSVTGLVNRVEFTTNFSSAWQVLHATNGNGGVMSALDSTTNGIPRFYRIRVAD